MTDPNQLKENDQTVPKARDKSPTHLQRFKNLLGVGPHLLLLGVLIEGLTVAIRHWISFPLFLSLELQFILSVPFIGVFLLGILWFNFSLNLIKVNLLDGKKKLITYGPFNYVRHPLYATLLLTIPPLVIIWFSDLVFLIPWVVILIISHHVVSLEERELIKIFGDDYKKYRKFVPSLLPFKGAGGNLYRRKSYD